MYTVLLGLSCIMSYDKMLMEKCLFEVFFSCVTLASFLVFVLSFHKWEMRAYVLSLQSDNITVEDFLDSIKREDAFIMTKGF